MKPALFLVALAVAPLSSCSLLGWTTPVDVYHELVILENGVEYQEIIVGEGPGVELEQLVTVDYTGYLSDGNVFDSSIERGYPIEFVLGAAPLAGWNDGILGMQTGGRRHISLPPELAYGEAGVPGLVPADEPLVFEIELLQIHE